MTQTQFVFDAAAYSASLNDAVTGWKTADNRSGVVARHALAAIVSTALSPLQVALSFYDAVKPTDGKGKACEPKEADDGSLRVRNLGQPHIAGSDGARKCLETVIYIANNRSVSPEAALAVEAFIIGGRKAMKLNPLRRFIETEKARIAREANDASGVKPDAPAPDTADDDAPVTTAEKLADMLSGLRAIERLGDNVELVALQAIAAEIDRLSATLADADGETAQAA